VKRARRLDDVAQHAVDAKAHDRPLLVGLEVQIRCPLAQRLQEERVDHADDGRLRGAIEQVFGDRHVLHEPRKIVLAREVADDHRRARGLVVRASELEREGLRVHVASHERALQHAADLDDTVGRGIRSHEHDDGVAFSSGCEHAVRPGERIRNLRRELCRRHL